MKHPNAILLEKLYSSFAEGKFDSMLASCADQITFSVPGRSRLAGKFTKANFIQDYVAKLGELSGQTYQLEVHDILAGDQHAAVLTTDRTTRGNKTTESRGVQIWRFENGKPVAWYQYPRDLYQFDAIWS